MCSNGMILRSTVTLRLQSVGRRTCAGSWVGMPRTIMNRGFIARWTRMPHSIGRLSASAWSHRSLSSAVFITNIAESDFRHAQPSVGVDVRPVNVNDPVEIERRVTAFAQSANGGLIVTASALSGVHRNLIAMLAARHKLPSVSSVRVLAAAGVVVSYGPNLSNQYRQAAGYVDRILKGEKPADLPVQAPTKYELVVNLKTAKALGLEVPPSVLARADEVIE